MAIWGHDYSNFEGGKTYLIYPLDLIDKFWPSKWESRIKNGTFNYSPKHNKIGKKKSLIC